MRTIFDRRRSNKGRRTTPHIADARMRRSVFRRTGDKVWTYSGASEVISKSYLPSTAGKRKNIPLYSGLIKYFPNALIAVAELSRIGNDQHNPGQPLHWAREKSGDELDALTRHLFEAGTRDTDNVRHSTKVAWRALANLQKEIETSTK